MDATKPVGDTLQDVNSAPDSASATNNSASTPQSKAPSAEPWAWPSHTSNVPANSTAGPSFPQFSASTAEILKRLQAKPGNASGSAAFEAKKAEILQSYVTSDKLPTPPPLANTGRRGRGGKIGTPSTLKTEIQGTHTFPVGTTPPSARGSGRGRGRGRGRGGGRGGKRKRSESVESDDDSDISSTYTPLPTRTKSGRSVNKPVAFVPTLPEPSPGVKRRRSTKTMLSAKCKTCQRETDPNNNRIVFCDSCNTAYHQYCHSPPISNEVVNILEKEWLCAPCERSKQNVIEGTDDLVSAESLSTDEKRAYFSTLPQARLVSLLLHATIRHPELPVFPHGVHNLIPDTTSTKPPHPNWNSAPERHQFTSGELTSQSITSPANGHGSFGGTPQSQPMGTDSSEMDSAEAQLLGETVSHAEPQSAPPIHDDNNNNALNQIATTTNQDQHDDGYDTDPPSHYPKAGQGLARTLRPESEDLQWLVDDNFEVFSHGWKGDGTRMGADGSLDPGGASASVA